MTRLADDRASMSARASFYLFDSPNDEERFLLSQWKAESQTRHRLFVPQVARLRTIRALVQQWEEREGKNSDYWIGRLWDIPLIRHFLNRLREKTPAQVLGEMTAWKLHLGVYLERDQEGLRCLQEMLESEDRVMPVSRWQELAGLCRDTVIEQGDCPLLIDVFTEADCLPSLDRPLWVARCDRRWFADDELPKWCREATRLICTATRLDPDGREAEPLLSWAEQIGCDVQLSHFVVRAGEFTSPERTQGGSGGEVSEAFPPVTMNHDIFSVTELETYARSPFAYFAEYILRLTPKPADSHDMSAAEQGLLVHRTLELFFSQHAQELSDPAQELKALQEKMTTLFEQELSSFCASRPELVASLVERRRQQISRALAQIIAEECVDLRALPDRPAGSKTGLRPSYFEWSFGRGDVPPLEIIGIDGNTIRLRGRVDRIDVDHQNKTFRVIDYKTGARRISESDLESGRSLQMPLYLQAVQERLLPGYEPLGFRMHYLHDMKQKDFTAQDYLEPSLQRVRESVAAIRAGHFSPLPKPCADFCSYRDICHCGASS